MEKIMEESQAGFSVNGKDILRGVNIAIEEGAAVAVTGANGSGKSSLIKLLAGICEPQTGKIHRNFNSHAYVPEHFPEHLPFTIKKYLDLLREMSGGRKKEEVSHYTTLFGLDSFLDVPLKKCSKGTKQKAGFIQALLKEADVLFLDEPFTGLDENAVQSAVDLLLERRGRKTMVFTLHEFALVQQLATHMAVIEEGRLVSFSAVQKKSGIMLITCQFSAPLPENVLQADKLAERTYRLTVQKGESDKVLRQILRNGGHIIEVRAGEAQ
ncbi:ATP-binding cassette domain-containing protein [Bacillus aerolatus]|uniref:ATP-binding cassette domain-containing protein n=1 Tax=Bacillus aerolatus TaxID=2653354 RepID=A0A6I1FCK6_9BACI|nr:ABC transporter ATP-binding protein [Bacillus aerolatus]KAB7705023.1 ATP-binding cassette domain-containing protein [Bacillus aerolatus]